jgi:predicted permease
MSASYGDVAQLALLPGFTLSFLGWICGTTNIIKAQHVNGLNRLSLKCLLPVNIFKTMTKFPLIKTFRSSDFPSVN